MVGIRQLDQDLVPPGREAPWYYSAQRVAFDENSLPNSAGLAAEDHHDIEVFLPNQIGDGTQYHFRVIAGLWSSHRLMPVAVEQRDMPIIFTTGYGEVPMTVQAMKAGAIDSLTKPFSDDMLLSAIRQAIERSPCCTGSRGEATVAPRLLRITQQPRMGARRWYVL
jgi:FixJ family two-component response regulator